MKEAHQAKVEAQLDEWRARLSLLEAKAAKATAQARLDLNKHVGELKDIEAAGRRHLDDLKKATTAAWDDVKKGAEEGWAKLDGATSALWAKIS